MNDNKVQPDGQPLPPQTVAQLAQITPSDIARSMADANRQPGILGALLMAKRMKDKRK